MTVPIHPKIYHILHVDRLPSIIANGGLWCDAEVQKRTSPGTSIGMNKIKRRRLNDLTLTSYPELKIGNCVPFYFCPRSVMLYLIYKRNHEELTYHGGQEPIIHLESDLHASVAWAKRYSRRWAFTLSNAGSYYFEDRTSLDKLSDINWVAVQARDWRDCRDEKQAEFLVERNFSWCLVERIGVSSLAVYEQVRTILQNSQHRPNVEVIRSWYY